MIGSCKTFHNLPKKITRPDFFRSKLSHKALNTATKSQLNTFREKYQLFKEDKLKPTEVMRERKRMYPEIQENLAAYLNAWKERYHQDNCGISWLFLAEKCKLWAHQFGYHDFKASSSFIVII